MMAALPNIGVEKNGAPSSAATSRRIRCLKVMVRRRSHIISYALVLVFLFAASFSNYTSSKSHHRPIVGKNLQIFAPQNVREADRAPLICVTKLHHIPTSWQRSRGAAFFGLED